MATVLRRSNIRHQGGPYEESFAGWVDFTNVKGRSLLNHDQESPRQLRLGLCLRRDVRRRAESAQNPFSQSAPTTGRGGYLPSGIGWYRKHFSLAQVPAASKVFIEFDGVMGNSSVYVNGTKIGTHPYGYVSFRYDITASVKFTGDNVLAVKTDTTLQPASRFYAGAGIYRHVRLVAAEPVHIDQYATYVTTPAPTAVSAKVHVRPRWSTAGTAAASVNIEGIVSDPSGTALPAVTTVAQNIAAGASASFTYDVQVANPKLWDLKSPNMYQVLTKVQVGGNTVDDDLTSFGIEKSSSTPA